MTTTGQQKKRSQQWLLFASDLQAYHYILRLHLRKVEEGLSGVEKSIAAQQDATQVALVKAHLLGARLVLEVVERQLETAMGKAEMEVNAAE
jgi:hypothetical protein